jgi:rRNA processing protein Gar1
MIPTIFSLITEKGRYRYNWICIGCMNALGAMPWVLSMWFGRHSIEVALGMLANVTTIITIYTIASIGWVIHRVIPPIVETYIKVSAHKRIQSLYEEQQSLIDEWGSGVVEETAKLRS